jgi:hypothetical protein
MFPTCDCHSKCSAIKKVWISESERVNEVSM